MGKKGGGRTEEFAGLSLLDLIGNLVLLLLDGELVISEKSNLTDSTVRERAGRGTKEGKEGSERRARSSKKDLSAFGGS